MAIIPNGILGKTTQKVGPVIASSWKGINYIKERVTPKNPRTPVQQAHRQRYMYANNLARLLRHSYMKDVETPCLKYQNNILTWQMAFIQRNIKSLSINSNDFYNNSSNTGAVFQGTYNENIAFATSSPNGNDWGIIAFAQDWTPIEDYNFKYSAGFAIKNNEIIQGTPWLAWGQYPSQAFYGSGNWASNTDKLAIFTMACMCKANDPTDLTKGYTDMEFHSQLDGTDPYPEQVAEQYLRGLRSLSYGWD